MKTTVHRRGDQVLISGAKGWCGADKGSSVHAAQEAVMQAIGEKITYDTLLGVSGLAFRMQIHKQAFCPSSPHSHCGYKCVARSLQALPWEVRVFEVKAEEQDQVQEARRAVIESIDRGVPVQYGSEEDGIIVGYQRGGDEWICYHPLQERGSRTFVETKWPWGIAVFTARKQRLPSSRDLALGALQQGATMARTSEAGAYFVGFKAWEEYIARLEALDHAEESTRRAAMLGNAWIYECLVQYRAVAARYLRAIAREFDEPVTAYLMRAAGHYSRMSSEVLVDGERRPGAIAPYPSMLRDGEGWSTKTRADQVRRLQDALALERQAIGEIEHALALLV
ncbi:MAG: hypothetical protein AB1486_21420 [Planctomycetota bacterium]